MKYNQCPVELAKANVASASPINFKPTNANLRITADHLERHAKDSLTAYILLGQVD